MVENESMGAAKETKKDEKIGSGEVKAEMKSSAGVVEKTEISNVEFEEIQKGKTKETALDLDFILDLPLTITVELGRTKMLISELLQLGQGSVIELTKFAGEPMDVFVNNRLIAQGEVVVVNEKFGVKLTNVISHAERLNRLK
jgi:flagellar motor switch protein FliN/FliY